MTNDNKNNREIAPWELLQKKMIWQQLSFINNKKVLDFGSGSGLTADHFAHDNEVVAIEPSEKMIGNRIKDNEYVQLKGNIDILKEIEDNTFDAVLCHNVLEYAAERAEIVKEFARVLKADGILSIVKHNRPGRVMQMVVLLNDFDHANALLNGQTGSSKGFGVINYYEDEDIVGWYSGFEIKKIYGIRAFWCLQQLQDIHKDKEWQDKMLSIETRVSEIDEYKAIAAFHHVILQNRNQRDGLLIRNSIK